MALKTLHMIFHTDGTLDHMIVTQRGGQPKKYRKLSEGTALDGEPPANVLWADPRDTLKFVEGDDNNCVVIDGMKFC